MSQMPNVSEQNKIDRMGSALLEESFSDQMIFIHHAGNTDFGIDYSVELINSKEKTNTGFFACLQLKSHKIIKFNSKGYYNQTVKLSTLNYWNQLNIPVVMVLADTTSKTFYGIDVKKYFRENYDSVRMSRKNVLIRVNQDDGFSCLKCWLAIQEYEKHNILQTSGTDALVLFNFLIHAPTSIRVDWFLPVDDYNDFTNDIIDLSEKYSACFFTSKDYNTLKDEMLKTIKHLLKYNRVMYDDVYLERDRSEFNQKAIDFIIKLVDLVCLEIDNDKTHFLALRLSKFKRLKKLIDDRGKPSYDNDKWRDLGLNELNCDSKW